MSSDGGRISERRPKVRGEQSKLLRLSSRGDEHTLSRVPALGFRFRRRPPFDTSLSPPRRSHFSFFALIATVLVYAAVRVLDIQRVVTIDEPVFLSITANFANAIARGDFAKTSQFLYPAVTVMWAGAIGFVTELPNYISDYPSQTDGLRNIHKPIREVGGNPLQALVAARIAKIAFQAFYFGIALWLMNRLFGLAVTAVAAAFIIFDPFLVAHDQLLHVDGVTGITAFVTMLAVAAADRRRTGWGLWVLAGVTAALCWLTRLTGLVLLPIMLLVIADGALVQYRQGTVSAKAALAKAAKTAAVVTGASLVTTILVWPALWVDPLVALSDTIEGWRAGIESPHPWGLYFAGETVTGDPGLLFYVFVFLYKITPFTLVGLGVISLAFLFRFGSLMPNRSWRPVVILAAFLIVYSLGMAAGARKFDRYILPNFLIFDLFAAIGVVGVARLLWTARHTFWKGISVLAVVGLVAGQIVSVQAQRPYMLDYYNPLLGGTEAAADMLMLGWGEGMDQVAEVILAQPGGESSLVRLPIPATSLIYFLPETTRVGGLQHLERQGQPGLLAWANTDYAVTYILQWKRNTFTDIGPYLADFDPISTVRIDGVDFARVYDLRRIPPPPWMIEPNDCRWQFDGKLTFAAYGQHRLREGETLGAREHMIELVFRTDVASPVTAAYPLEATLHPKVEGADPVSFTASLVPNPQSGLLAQAVATVQLPEGRTLGDYWLEVTVIDPASGRPLPAVQLRTFRSSMSAGLPMC
ncbi:MAG TPA: hypothetical protein VGR29_08825 [Thermomicrobiales bacterium]|nr:hypothetical protein [Thermomicrobiales bacterium]